MSISANPLHSLPLQTQVTTRSRLRVRPMWYNGLRCGQGFYDPNEGVIEYHIVPHDAYSSFIEAGPVRIDVDSTGSPVMVEVDISSYGIKNLDPAGAPLPQILSRHRFLDFPIRSRAARLAISCDNSLCHIRFSRLTPTSLWSFSPGCMWEVDSESCVVGLWLTDLISDPSGCRRAGWRAAVWQACRRGRLIEVHSLRSQLELGWLSLPKIFT